jgi:ATP adenylyltransferase
MCSFLHTNIDFLEQMNQDQIKSNILWEKVVTTTEYALKTGALHPIATECELIQQDEVKFILRILDSLQRKDKLKKEQKKKQKASQGNFNPFLPYDPNLFVADLSDTHVCLLNKFNVVNHHLLLITREFEAQENLLTLADFTAMWQVLKEIDGLGFYNGGKLAGASQPHKHLQLVPYPIAPNIDSIPLEKRITAVKFINNIGMSPYLPFLNAIAFFDHLKEKTPLEAAKITLDYYHQLLSAVGLESQGKKQSGAYNLLITRDWLWVVPRALEKFVSISINSLGFAGALLVKNEKQRQLLLDTKPLNVLKKVAVGK